MYQPFTALCRWNDPIAIYTDLYTIGGDTYLRNEAYDDPRHEMMRPSACFHAPMNQRPTVGKLGLTNNLGPDGAYGGAQSQANVDSPVIQDGPNSLLVGQQCNRVTSTENAFVSQGAGFTQNGGNTRFGFSLWYKLDDHTATRANQTLLQLHVDDVSGALGHNGMLCSLTLDRSNSFYKPSVKLQTVGLSPPVQVTLSPDDSENPWEADYYHSGWNHVAYKMWGTGALASQTMWLNGRQVDASQTSFNVLDGPTTDPPSATLAPDVYINRSTRSLNSGIDGSIAFVTIYSGDLQDSDVIRHYQSMIRGLDLKCNDHIIDRPLRNRTDAQYTRTFTWNREPVNAEPRALNFQLDDGTRPFAFQSDISERTQAQSSFIGGIQLKDDNDASAYTCNFFRHMSRINVGSPGYTWTDLSGVTQNSSNNYITPFRGWSFERYARNMLVRWHDGNALAHRTLQTSGGIGGWATQNVPKYECIGGSVKDGGTSGQALVAAGDQVVTYDKPANDNWRLDQGEAGFRDGTDHFYAFQGGQDDTSGSGLQDHNQRMGPVAILADSIDESKYKWMRRVMLGQKPLRTRRPTRTVYRHIGLTGPSRIIQ